MNETYNSQGPTGTLFVKGVAKLPLEIECAK